MPHATQSFNRAVCMPNLVPPVKNTSDALAYRERILQAYSKQTLKSVISNLDPRMTLYLTDTTTVADIQAENQYCPPLSYILFEQPPTRSMGLPT